MIPLFCSRDRLVVVKRSLFAIVVFFARLNSGGRSQYQPLQRRSLRDNKSNNSNSNSNNLMCSPRHGSGRVLLVMAIPTSPSSLDQTGAVAASAGLSMPSAQRLTLERQHICAIEGLVPTLQNIVATVNLDCHLDARAAGVLHARNAEYNPKVGTTYFGAVASADLLMLYLHYRTSLRL
jgi:hypothetical protein